MELTEIIREAVESISSIESKRVVLGEKLKKLKAREHPVDSKEIFEERLSFSLKKIELNERIAGVDSGFVGKNLFFLDLVLVRGVGVVFDYEKGIVKKAHYHPNFFYFPIPHLSGNSLELDELNCSKGIIRLQQEIRTAIEIIEKHSPKYCFLDGSIIPQYADKPRKDSKIKSIYHGLIQSFEQLFETAREKDCRLIACVEDSRGNRFSSILQDHILKNEAISEAAYLSGCFDAVLLDYFLETGERSMVFKYSSSTKEHPILADFSEKWRDSIFACYLKPAVLDRPLRIEFLHSPEKELSEETDEVASIAFSLSSLHREYAFPSVLIEADLHARLKPEEIEIVYNKIMDKLGKKMRLKLRRDSRPF